jgi:hypothetical protein
MTRELLGRVSKASQELFGQNASLRAPRVFETKTGELLRPESSWDERNPCLGAVSGNLVRKIPEGTVPDYAQAPEFPMISYQNS